MLDTVKKYGPLVGGIAAVAIMAKLLHDQSRESKYQQRRTDLRKRLGLKTLQGPAQRRKKWKDPNPADYLFFVITPSKRIESGWDFRSDAADHVADLPKGSKVRIVARRTLRSLGVDPANTSLWTQGMGSDAPLDLKGWKKR